MKRLVIEGLTLEVDYYEGEPRPLLGLAQEWVVRINDSMAEDGYLGHPVLVGSDETCKVSVEEVQDA